MSADSPDVIVGEDGRGRCAWGATDAEYRRYHDEEWATALHGDQQLFEKLSLEGFQAGLSWITILRRRPAFRDVFFDFEIERVAAMDDSDVERLMNDPRIIRNRAKILATLSNARIIADMVRETPGALDELMWSFAPPTGGRTPRTFSEVPAITTESTAMSAALKKRGLRFVGPTTLYALMQSSGMVDDHLEGCFRASGAG
jgi:DNA-3-methyladenine glycosylase I